MLFGGIMHTLQVGKVESNDRLEQHAQFQLPCLHKHLLTLEQLGNKIITRSF